MRIAEDRLTRPERELQREARQLGWTLDVRNNPSRLAIRYWLLRPNTRWPGTNHVYPCVRQRDVRTYLGKIAATDPGMF